jgi:hypothetical protein
MDEAAMMAAMERAHRVEAHAHHDGFEKTFKARVFRQFNFAAEVIAAEVIIETSSFILQRRKRAACRNPPCQIRSRQCMARPHADGIAADVK